MSEQEPIVPARIIDRKTTPRGLIVTDDDDFAEKLDEVLPTAHRGHHNVREAEYDLIVTTERVVNSRGNYLLSQPAAHLSVVSFGASLLPSIVGARRTMHGTGGVTLEAASVAREYQLPAELPDEFRALVEGDLLTVVRRRQAPHPVLAAEADEVPASAVTPLLMTGDGGALAGLYQRAGEDGGLVLALPGDVEDRLGWVRAALKHFRARWPERYESIPGWEERDEWATAPERQLRTDLRAVEAERRGVIVQLDARASELRARLAEAATGAEAGTRRLLTTQGTTLVEAAIDALERLGFSVVDVDATADRNNKVEDLRVSDPDDESWEALVEVRGYARGASLKDLMRTERFARRYRDQEDRWPPALWYLVNQFAGRDPDLRPPVLSSQPDELKEWAENFAGLAIDTSELFQLVTAVEQGELDRAEARKQLRCAQGRYEFRDDVPKPHDATVEAGSEQEPTRETPDDDAPLADADPI